MRSWRPTVTESTITGHLERRQMATYLKPLKKYCDFSGRATRQEYWSFYLFQFLVTIGLVIAAGVGVALLAAGQTAGWILAGPGGLGLLGFSLYTLVPMLAAGVRRLHDRGMSGWFMLLGLIPYVGGIILIVLLALPGDGGTNKYGDDPKAIGE
jgi:uncharacterized membrane protein YhaH (DUF805 family)